jgi:hypothetical protein
MFLGGLMTTSRLAMLVALACAACFAAQAQADEIITSIGSQHFTSGTKVTTSDMLGALSGQPAPFNAFCGSDIILNCSASWTFSYTVPVGDVVTNATLKLGIWDIDSAAVGNQIGSFTLNGSNNLTATLNTAAQAINGGAGSPNSFYDVLSIVIPGADLSTLAGGSATFALALSGPGAGILPLLPTLFNGAALDFSTLDVTATPGHTPPPVPEPSSIALLLAGLAGISVKTVKSFLNK